MGDLAHQFAVLGVLFTHVVGLALITFGGVNTVLPALHHQAVNEQHWMTDRDFANFFALSTVSPGPNFLLLTLIGYKAAGVAGAVGRRVSYDRCAL
jgi:chromate transporter